MSNAEAAASKRQGRVAPTQLPGEEWRAVAEFPGYEVSSLGRVRAIRILSTHVKNDYECVGIYSAAGRQRNQRINRLACEAFHGPCEGRQAAHLDGNSLNNRADNLAWVTQGENEQHKLAHGTRYRAGVSRGKLNPENVSEIKAKAKAGVSQRALATMFGVAQGTISAVCSGRTWRVLTEQESA